jgi:acetyl esterase/lipase
LTGLIVILVLVSPFQQEERFMRIQWRTFVGLGLFLSAPVAAQIQLNMTPILAPSEKAAISLNTGSVPGMPAESWFSDRGQRVVRNVSHATLTPFLPRAGAATGAAVIVAPGGGFAQLSMDNEGWPVARWLADHGIAAFVLKYRLNPSATSLESYKQEVTAKIAASQAGKLDLSTPPAARADALAAIRMVRHRATEWGIDPKRVGFLGFSAGAMTTLSLIQAAPAEDMPNFAAPIYGPMVSMAVPSNAPPMFIALASDDPLFGNQGYGLAESWKKTGKPVELHVFQSGSHGFGLGQPGTTTVGWIEGFRTWLETNGFLGRASAQQ